MALWPCGPDFDNTGTTGFLADIGSTFSMPSLTCFFALNMQSCCNEQKPTGSNVQKNAWKTTTGEISRLVNRNFLHDSATYEYTRVCLPTI